jgi:FkbM family methyltransferase
MVKSALKQVGIYYRFRQSFIHDIYWMLADKASLEFRNKEIQFYRDLLQGFRPGDLILDIGANGGDKTDIFLRLGARVVAVEPDQHCQEILRAKFIGFRVLPKPVVIIGKATSETAGVETMWIDGPGSALNTLSRKWAESLKTEEDRSRFGHTFGLQFNQERTVGTTTLEELSFDHGVPFFVKIDVEGHELSTLKGMRKPVPYLSFEVNLPEFREEGLECLEYLNCLAPSGEFNYAIDCRRGLLLNQWVDRRMFSEVLEGCMDRCVEVFWRTPQANSDQGITQ